MKQFLKISRVFLFIAMISILSGCNKSESNETNETDEAKVYESLWDVSMLGYNNTWNYTEKQIDCELYKWGEYANLPVPMIEGSSGMDVMQNGLYVFGISEDEWVNYMESIKKDWNVIIREEDDEEMKAYYGNAYDMYIYNTKYNYCVDLHWRENDPYNNSRNCVSVNAYVGCQKKSSELTNEEVLKKVEDKLGEENSGYTILNVSSDTNVEDGFGVYYIETHKENDGKTIISYLCVVKDSEIVLLEPNTIIRGWNDSAEFLEKDGKWILYVTCHSAIRKFTSGVNDLILLEFELEDGWFELKSENSVYNLAEFDGYYGDGTLIKKEQEIHLVSVKNNSKQLNEDGSIPRYKTYYLGETVGVIDGNEMETIKPLAWE